MTGAEPISGYSEGLLTYHFSTVARHLTGRKTGIVWQDYVYGIDKSAGPEEGEQWAGMARKAAAGGATIQIRRGLGWEQTMDVFLHEAAHVLKTYATLPDPTQRFYTFKDKYSTSSEYSRTPDEIDARRQKDIWGAWARAKAQTNLVVPQLEALMKYPNG
jgi:hypothetical protein